MNAANLEGEDLSRANLREANLTGTALSNANLTDANLQDASGFDADQVGIIYRNTFMPDGALRGN